MCLWSQKSSEHGCNWVSAEDWYMGCCQVKMFDFFRDLVLVHSCQAKSCMQLEVLCNGCTHSWKNLVDRVQNLVFNNIVTENHTQKFCAPVTVSRWEVNQMEQELCRCKIVIPSGDKTRNFTLHSEMLVTSTLDCTLNNRQKWSELVLHADPPSAAVSAVCVRKGSESFESRWQFGLQNNVVRFECLLFQNALKWMRNQITGVVIGPITPDVSFLGSFGCVVGQSTTVQLYCAEAFLTSTMSSARQWFQVFVRGAQTMGSFCLSPPVTQETAISHCCRTPLAYCGCSEASLALSESKQIHWWALHVCRLGVDSLVAKRKKHAFDPHLLIWFVVASCRELIQVIDQAGW